MFNIGLYRENILSKSTRPRALILCLLHHLVNLYQVCSNYAPGGQTLALSRISPVYLYTENPLIMLTKLTEAFPCKVQMILLIYLNSLLDIGGMLPYTFINSHSQVSDQGPKSPLV